MKSMTLLTFLLGTAFGCVLGSSGLIWAWNNFGWFGDKPVNELVATTAELELWQKDQVCILPIGTIMKLSSKGDPLIRLQMTIGLENYIQISKGPFFEPIQDNSISGFSRLYPVADP